MSGKFWHTGIIYDGKVYETFNKGRNSISKTSTRLPELNSQKSVYLKDVPIEPKKLISEIKSGTSCDEYVLRVTGHSNTKGDDKGKHSPTDVYNILSNKNT